MNRLFLYIISYIMIIAASTNDGFTYCYLGLPFAIFILADLFFQVYRRSYIAIIHTIILLFTGYLALVDRSTNKLLYPILNQTITLNEDANITHNEFFQNEFEFDYEKPYKEKKYSLKKGSKFIVKKKIVLGHPEFTIDYIYVLECINNKKLAKKFISNAKSFKPKFEDMSPAYKELSRDYIYIDSIGLSKFSYVDSFYWLNIFEIFLVSIIYFPMLIMFIILLIRYYKKVVRTDFTTFGHSLKL